MKPNPLSIPLTIIGLVFRLIPAVLVVGFYLWMSGTIKDNGGNAVDTFGPHVIATLLGLSALVGAVFWVMKRRAPREQDIHLRALEDEADGTTFDADAAIERYLQDKASGEAAAPPRDLPVVSRPVFGKRRN